MFRHLLFDFDGTLVDSKEVFISVFNQLAEKHRFRKMLPEQLEELRKLSILQRCEVLELPVYKLPFLAKDLYGLYKNSISRLNFFAGIPEALQQLSSRGYQLHIVSSNSEAIIRALLQQHGIGQVSQVVCSSNIFGKEKLIRKFLKSSRAKPAEVLYVGDEVRDIIACRQAGVKIAWVSWGYDLFETAAPENPDFIISAPAQLLALAEMPGVR